MLKFMHAMACCSINFHTACMCSLQVSVMFSMSGTLQHTYIYMEKCNILCSCFVNAKINVAPLHITVL